MPFPEDEKKRKKRKKVLTIGGRSGILTKLSARAAEAVTSRKKVNEFCKK